MLERTVLIGRVAAGAYQLVLGIEQMLAEGVQHLRNRTPRLLVGFSIDGMGWAWLRRQ